MFWVSEYLGNLGYTEVAINQNNWELINIASVLRW